MSKRTPLPRFRTPKIRDVYGRTLVLRGFKKEKKASEGGLFKTSVWWCEWQMSNRPTPPPPISPPPAFLVLGLYTAYIHGAAGVTTPRRIARLPPPPPPPTPASAPAPAPVPAPVPAVEVSPNSRAESTMSWASVSTPAMRTPAPRNPDAQGHPLVCLFVSV